MAISACRRTCASASAASHTDPERVITASRISCVLYVSFAAHSCSTRSASNCCWLRSLNICSNGLMNIEGGNTFRIGSTYSAFPIQSGSHGALILILPFNLSGRSRSYLALNLCKRSICEYHAGLSTMRVSQFIAVRVVKNWYGKNTSSVRSNDERRL